MKLLRLLLIGTGILAVVLAVILVSAFVPSVQTWAARRVIADNPSLGITRLGRVSAGFQRIDISDVAIVRPGFSVALPTVTIELPLIDAARGNIQLRRLVAKGWTLDLTAPPSSAPSSPGILPAKTEETAKSFNFEGVFKLLELPVDLAVESADIDGVVIFPVKPGKPPGRASLKIEGGQLAVGREGRFTIAAEAVLPDGLAPVTRLTTTSTLALRMDTPRTFTRVTATNESHATGPGLPQGARLFSESIVSRESDRETYQVLIKSVTVAGEKKLVELGASNPAGGKPFSGTWKFDVSDSDLSPFTLGRVLPKFTLGAAGTFEADQRFQEVKLAGKTDLAADQLDFLYAGLSTLGRIQVLADFDLVHRNAGLRVNRLAVDMIGKTPVVSVKVLQALEVVPATGEIKVASPDTDLVQIELKGVPLDWARPFVPPDLTVTGQDVRGELVARADQGGFAVRSISPILLGNLTVVRAGQTLLSALDLSITATGSHTTAGWQADVSEIAAGSRGTALFNLAARAGQSAGTDQLIKVTGRLHAELPAIMAQPVAAEFSVLTQGAANMEFTASVSAALRQISSKLSLTGLRANNGQNLPAVSSDLRADLHADGRIETNVPLVFDLAGRKSDLDLTASVKSGKTGLALDAQVLSRELYLDDLKLFAALQPPAAPASEPAKKQAPASGPKAPAPDTKPVWDGVTGQLKLALKKVVYAATQPPVEISTSVKITPGVLTLESLNAVFPDGAAAKVDGVIKFESTAPAPYDVNANVSATGFDPQPFLAAANPGKPPTIEGKFDLTGKLFGRTPSLDQLADKASLDAQMVCRGGRFHGFATSALAANVGGKGQETVSKLANAVSIFSSALGKSDVARGAEKTRAYSDSVGRLVNFNFDQLNIDLSHRPGEAKTEIKNFSLISPDLRLLGSGSIDNTPGVSFFQRTLTLELQMAVRGAQADDLRIMGRLKNEADSLGYTSVIDAFTVQGSLGRMSAESLFRLWSQF